MIAKIIALMFIVSSFGYSSPTPGMSVEKIGKGSKLFLKVPLNIPPRGTTAYIEGTETFLLESKSSDINYCTLSAQDTQETDRLVVVDNKRPFLVSSVSRRVVGSDGEYYGYYRVEIRLTGRSSNSLGLITCFQARGTIGELEKLLSQVFTLELGPAENVSIQYPYSSGLESVDSL